ncbi:MAG: insulinase family protein [Oscillospiraceae bacterium]|nr:insulinase family protein [Oscillospiraceae bacterium]
MIETIELFPGITLRCFPDQRFKHACLSVQLVRPMDRAEVAMNALLPAVLLRGTRLHRDLRDITLRLDELYGASVSALVRRVGDYQTTGVFCSFVEDKYALPGDRVLEPMVEFLGELLFQPIVQDGGFHPGYVESEKKNLIATIESELNDKRAYAAGQMLKLMCKADSFGIPRLGEKDQVADIEAKGLYDHYQKILRQSRIELFYVGSAAAEKVAVLLKNLFSHIERSYVNLPNQTPFLDAGEGGETVEQMEVAQGKLCMGFVTPITNRDPQFGAIQLCNTILGAGMTSKLFMNVREKLSLCYSIGSGYHGSKGVITVSAGIDSKNMQVAKDEILRQLEACKAGDITLQELTAAKEAVYSSLRGTHDSPGAIEGYYSTANLSGLGMTPQQYMSVIQGVTAEQVAAAARTVRLHTTYFLKGVDA